MHSSKFIFEHGPADIIKDLEAIVNIYQKEADADVNRLHHLEQGVLALTFVLLLFEAFLIFGPMVRRIRESMIKIGESAAEIKKQAEAIETIYSNVKSGFLLVYKDMAVQPGRS